MARIIAAAAAFAIAGSAAAQFHVGDIAIERDAENRIVFGEFDVPTGTVVFGSRVFNATLDEDLPAFWYTDDPGFDSEDGAFAAGSLISFGVRKALRQWDPVEQDFDTIAAATMELSWSIFGPVAVPASDPAVPAVLLSIPVANTGEFHRHPGYEILRPADEGIYALELELGSNEPGVLTSEPIWLVFRTPGADQQQQLDAMAWIEANWVGGASCPADLSSPQSAGVPDGVLTGADFFEFLSRFQNGDLSVDFSSPTSPGVGDGVLTGADFFEFLNLFSQGCP